MPPEQLPGQANYDAVILVSFGGPEKRADVIPFLENVLRGKPVPRERMLEVAEHYYTFEGVSPINTQNEELVAALRAKLQADGPNLPVYWGNRNWHPLLPDTLRQMRADGIQRALAFVTSAYSSYSGCRQYLENIAMARDDVGQDVPRVDKLRVFYNHPRFIQAAADRVAAAITEVPAERHARTQLIYTAHSIPEAMSRGCQYVLQLEETGRLVSKSVGDFDWRLVYQSRSGAPSQRWLEPDIGDYLRAVNKTGKYTDAVIVPIGFVSDHLEVLFDLDCEARVICDELGLNMVRAATVGTHPEFIHMIHELILERTSHAPRRAAGQCGPAHDDCPADCCPSGMTSQA